MKLLIDGCRWYAPTFNDISDAVAKADFDVKEVLCSGFDGASSAGERWARRKGLPVQLFGGRMSNPKRSAEMATYADALLVFWDGRSKVTGDLIRNVIMLEKPVWVEMIEFHWMES
jgi:hypothetical protein